MNDVLNGFDREAVARDGVTVDLDVSEVTLIDTLGVHAAGAGDVLQDAFDVLPDALDNG